MKRRKPNSGDKLREILIEEEFLNLDIFYC